MRLAYIYSLTICDHYRDVDGVIRRANATEYGLASGVFTKDLSKVAI